MVRYRDMKRNKQKGNKMKLSEITGKDYINIREIIGNGDIGIEDNIGKLGCMTQNEFDRAMEVIDMFLSEIIGIVKKNEKE